MATRIKSPKLSEAAIEKTCCQFLALDGWRILKTDPVSNSAWGKGFGEPGMADTLCIRYLFSPVYARYERDAAQVMWVEWKSRTGRRKQHQKEWQGRERSRGALVICAKIDFPRTIEGFAQWYAGSGLQRKSFQLAGSR